MVVDKFQVVINKGIDRAILIKPQFDLAGTAVAMWQTGGMRPALA
jgi:hypothetical protein